MTRPLNLVFLGCGAVTARHSRTLAGLGDRVRCYYASRDRHRAMAFERRFGGAGSFAGYDAALADGWIDVALVATPPAHHLELTLAALRSGKHVIVEKPAFQRARDVDQVREAMAASGRRVLVAENYAYKPLARTLRGLLAEGAVGDLRFVRVSAVKRQPAEGWRGDPGQAGGGALFEGGVHWVDLVANLGPAVRSVRAFRAGGGRLRRGASWSSSNTRAAPWGLSAIRGRFPPRWAAWGCPASTGPTARSSSSRTASSSWPWAG